MDDVRAISCEERFQWGPIPGVPYYVMFPGIHGVSEAFRLFGIGWPEGHVFFYRGDHCVWYGNQNEVDEHGLRAADLVYRPSGRMHSIRSQYQECIRQLGAYRTYISPETLAQYDTGQLIAYYLTVVDVYARFWNAAIFPELIGYGLSAYLSLHIRKHVSEHEVDDTLGILTSPHSLTFHQQEELAFLNIVGSILDQHPPTPCLADSEHLREWIERSSSRLGELVRNHHRDHEWILHNHTSGKPIDIEYFYQRLLDMIRSDTSPNDIRSRIYEQHAVHEERRRDILQHIADEDFTFYAVSCADAVAWHDERKSWHLRIQTILHYFLSEFSRRYDVSMDDLLYLSPSELVPFLNGTLSLDDVHVLVRKQLSMLHVTPDSYALHVGLSVQKLFDAYRTIDVGDTVSEFSGIVASKGSGERVSGRVCVLRHPRDGSEMNHGDVLVAELTSPDYIDAIRKAAAIVTDAGGLTSHAAVVSRELNIPCVVNTKVASQVLKDGDTVEVDIKKGIVRKL